MDYVRRIRDLREDADKTQQQIADLLGTSQTMYARYERGANELPIRHLMALADYYRVSTDYILGRTDDPGGDFQVNSRESHTFRESHNSRESRDSHNSREEHISP